MPQAKLPDSNAAWVRYRNYGLECMDKKNYAGAVGALFEINALFPDAYRVEVNTDKYEQLEQERVILICKQCNKENNYNDVKFYNLLLNTTVSFIAGSGSIKVWGCLECKNENRLLTTKIIKNQLIKPSYHRVMRAPPNRKQSIVDRVAYHNEMVKWFFESLAELDHQLGKYREEYRPTDEIEDENLLEGGEDAD